jgi:transcription initiation factor TFIID subunit 3
VGRDSRVKGQGIDFEVAFVLSTLGYVLSALARTKLLKTLYASATPTPEQKRAAVQGATKNLLMASSVHAFLASPSAFSGLNAATESTITALRHHSPPSNVSSSPSTPIPDLDPATQSALSTLALAEATLLAVLKDDAYLSACIQSRNAYDREWMVKSPDIPKVRALLFARLCVRGAEYADQAAASADGVGGNRGKLGKVDENLLRYIRVLARVAKARACRFLGIDAELAGKVGEGIAWLRAGRAALGFKGSLAGDDGVGITDGKGTGKIGGGLSRLKREWTERREERKVEKEVASFRASEREAELDWGDDAGREEEGRVIDMLETKWVKMNDTVGFFSHLSSSLWLKP